MRQRMLTVGNTIVVAVELLSLAGKSGAAALIGQGLVVAAAAGMLWSGLSKQRGWRASLVFTVLGAAGATLVLATGSFRRVDLVAWLAFLVAAVAALVAHRKRSPLEGHPL